MPNVMVYQPNENWQAPRGFDFYCLGGSLNKMMPVFLWVRIGSAPFGKVQASSKTDIWPRAASCKDERLALSARFVLWMVAWEALPGAKFIAPMAEEAPVWGRQITCSMQGPGALKVSCATMKEQTWFPTPWPYKPINESIFRPGTPWVYHGFQQYRYLLTYWYRIWRVSSPQLAPNEFLIRDEDNLICSRGWGDPSMHMKKYACYQSMFTDGSYQDVMSCPQGNLNDGFVRHVFLVCFHVGSWRH